MKEREEGGREGGRDIYLQKGRYDDIQCLIDDIQTVLVVTAKETGSHECEYWHHTVQNVALEGRRPHGVSNYSTTNSGMYSMCI